MGVLVMFFVLFLVIWAAVSLSIVSRDRGQLKSRSIKFSLWLATMSVVCSLHWYYSVSARRAADQFEMAIEQYKARHGSYPENLMAAGLDAERAYRINLHYGVFDGRPLLVYGATLVAFDMYNYDFEHHVWVYQPD
jgi:hypothetical protein